MHKVVRWAFEAQGLYRSFTNAPGYPPPVDIFIESLRPTTDLVSGTLDYGKGSYVPVSLQWDLGQKVGRPSASLASLAGLKRRRARRDRSIGKRRYLRVGPKSRPLFRCRCYGQSVVARLAE